jgi:HlyD family secretion protein
VAERGSHGAPEFPADLLELAKTDAGVADLIDGQQRLFLARQETATTQTEQLRRRISQITSQIEGIDAQVTALKTQLDLIKAELVNQQALLEKGLAQATTVLSLQREEARLMGLSGELTASRAQAEGRITEIELEISRLASARVEDAERELREIGPALTELDERLRALDEQVSRLDIRAPVGGVVLGLTVTTPRAVIRPAEPLLYIVPQDRPLVIAAQVPPIHIDQVHVGQPVELVFSAFSSRTTPHLAGKVSVVSADAFTDQATHASFYRAEIVLDEGEIAKLEGQTLLPGMPVEAFIQTEGRTPLAYLVKPFTDYFARAGDPHAPVDRKTPRRTRRHPARRPRPGGELRALRHRWATWSTSRARSARTNGPDQGQAGRGPERRTGGRGRETLRHLAAGAAEAACGGDLSTAWCGR